LRGDPERWRVASQELFFQIVPAAAALVGVLMSDKVRAIIKSVFSHLRQTSVIEKGPDGSYEIHEEEPAGHDKR